MKFEYDEDTKYEYLDIALSKRELAELLRQEFVEHDFKHHIFKKPINLCIRIDDDATN